MNNYGIQEDEKIKFTREEFKKWFRELNKACLGPVDSILAEKPIYVRKGYYHFRNDCSFLRGKAIMPPMMFRMNGNIRNTDAAKECCHERMNDFNAPIFYE